MNYKEKQLRINNFKKEFPQFKNVNITLVHESDNEGYVFSDGEYNYISKNKMLKIYIDYIKENNFDNNFEIDFVLANNFCTVENDLIILNNYNEGEFLYQLNITLNDIFYFRKIFAPIIHNNIVYTYPVNINKYRKVDKKIKLINPILPIFKVTDNFIPFLVIPSSDEIKTVINLFPEKYSNMLLMNFINLNMDEFDFKNQITLEDIIIIGSMSHYVLLSI